MLKLRHNAYVDSPYTPTQPAIQTSGLPLQQIRAYDDIANNEYIWMHHTSRVRHLLQQDASNPNPTKDRAATMTPEEQLHDNQDLGAIRANGITYLEIARIAIRTGIHVEVWSVSFGTMVEILHIGTTIPSTAHNAFTNQPLTYSDFTVILHRKDMWTNAQTHQLLQRRSDAIISERRNHTKEESHRHTLQM